jgi:hypothetical protein
MNWSRCGKKRPWFDLKSYPGMSFEELREHTKYLGEDNGCHDLE